MNIPDYFTESLKAVFWFKILKFFDADPEAGIRNVFDPGSVMGLLPYVHKKNRHLCQSVFRIRIHMVLGHPDPLVRDMDPDPDPSIIMQK
jgi:hypothetical protein